MQWEASKKLAQNAPQYTTLKKGSDQKHSNRANQMQSRSVEYLDKIHPQWIFNSREDKLHSNSNDDLPRETMTDRNRDILSDPVVKHNNLFAQSNIEKEGKSEAPMSEP